MIIVTNGVTLPMERKNIEVYTEKSNSQPFSSAEHHIRSRVNSEVNFECVEQFGD